jgi:hypothetical protein
MCAAAIKCLRSSAASGCLARPLAAPFVAPSTAETIGLFRSVHLKISDAESRNIAIMKNMTAHKKYFQYLDCRWDILKSFPYIVKKFSQGQSSCHFLPKIIEPWLQDGLISKIWSPARSAPRARMPKLQRLTN